MCLWLDYVHSCIFLKVRDVKGLPGMFGRHENARKKGFPEVLSCNRSLKRALSRLSEILKLATDENSLERGLARLSEHSS